VVTVDCGITAQAEAQVARQLGMDLIITDHHTPGAELPEAFAVINPLQPGCAYPFKSLAGVGIAFALLIALRSRFRQEGLFGEGQEPNLRQYLDLVALGTIADVVPLVEENRIFVRHGLLELTAARRVGVAALKEVAAVKGEVSCGQVGFRLAPRLNAAGRLHDATLGVELLLTEDPEHARNLARQLDESNRERQSVEQEILAQAVAQVEGNEAFRHRRSIVLAAEGWHPGVFGIVASRLVELFHRPTVLIALANGTGRGSARSIPHFHLYDALAACGEYLAKFGGHRQAAGLSLDQGILTQFIHRFEEVAAGLLTDDQLQPELAIDAELKAEEVTERLLTDISTLAPFGMGNPEPIFTITAMQVTNRRVVGGGHLKLSLRSGGRQFDAIGFGMGSRLPTSDRVDLAFSLSENEWQGERSLQLRLRDIRDAVS
jgi:single-stranded-DNA-specific exonuclease